MARLAEKAICKRGGGGGLLEGEFPRLGCRSRDIGFAVSVEIYFSFIGSGHVFRGQIDHDEAAMGQRLVD